MKRTGMHVLQSIFNVNHPFWQSIEKIFTIFILNILFVLTCLPIFTLGLAKVALFGSLSRLQADGKIAVVTTYLAEARKNWKSGLVSGLVELLVVGICLLDLFLTNGSRDLGLQIFQVFCFAILILSQLISPYVYCLLSRSSLPLSQIFQASLIEAGRHLGLTIGLMATLALLIFLSLLNGFIFLLTLSVMLIIGCAGLSYLFLLNYKTTS